jgi:hypothetical protein
MIQLSDRIEKLFKISQEITLKKGGPYEFIKQCPTKIGGQPYEFAFEYQISEKNKRRVTLDLIGFLYILYQKNGKFIQRNELLEPFITELKSRPCNYSVAKFIVNQLIKEHQLNK